jgi:hypothetical protein
VQTRRMDYVVGSNESQVIKSDGITAGSEGPPEGDPSAAGECHAVPRGTFVAICRTRVRYVFDEDPWAVGQYDERCPKCKELSGWGT